nr:hypothetical protein BaRGS_028899 [Batillaria attramentaria]
MSKVQINRRLVYILAFLFIAIPVLVGVLVWHFTDKNNDNASSDSSLKSQTPTVVQKPISEKEPRSKNTTATGSASTNTKTSTPTITTTTTRPPTQEEIARQPWLGLRLPDSQHAVHYDITLYPDFYDDHGSFYGNETVDIEIRRKTKFLLIHVFHKLDVTEVELLDMATKVPIVLARHFYAAPNQFLVVEAEDEMDVGSEVQLKLRFNGSLTDSIVGFYKSSYVNSQTGETR